MPPGIETIGQLPNPDPVSGNDGLCTGGNTSPHFLHGGELPSFSAVHDQEYSPRVRDGCRTEIWPDFRCESKARLGGGDWNLTVPEQILPTCHGVHIGNAEEIFPGTPVFPEKYGEYVMDLRVHTPAARQRNFAGALNRVFRLRTSPRSFRRSVWRA